MKQNKVKYYHFDYLSFLNTLFENVIIVDDVNYTLNIDSLITIDNNPLNVKFEDRKNIQYINGNDILFSEEFNISELVIDGNISLQFILKMKLKYKYTFINPNILIYNFLS